MGAANVVTVAFNRGLVSRLALARTDMARLQLMATTMTNWLPLSLGSMTLRPGLAYIGSTRNNAFAWHIPFIFSTSDTAIIECAGGVIRVLLDEEIITRVAVSTAVTNGTFAADLTGWTDADEVGAASTWGGAGAMLLIGTDFAAAIRRQQLTIAGGDIGKEHGLRISIARNPVILRIGTSAGGDDLIPDVSLGVGEHSVAFTPITSAAHLQFSNIPQVPGIVHSVSIEAAGAMELAHPWSDDILRSLRYEQSGDVVFVACDGVPQRRIERHQTRSWSLVQYQPSDGPVRNINTGPITIAASGKDGAVMLTASRPLFRLGDVGGVWKITSVGQSVTGIFNGDGQWTDPIKVTGRAGARNVIVSRASLAGTGSSVTLQRSLSTIGNWTGVVNYTTNGGTTYNDDLDDQIAWYRIGTDTGNYSSGSPVATLDYAAGGITGFARIVSVASTIVATADVTKSLGSLTPTVTWYESAWSGARGWPSALAFYEGRLWWAGKDHIWGSVSDAFDSFDSAVEGDSGPISRSIGSGPVDFINWLQPSQRLIIGGQGSEISARSTTFDEPLTPTNFNLKDASTRGSSNVAAIKVDSRVFFVSRSGERLFDMHYDFASNDYVTEDLTIMNPDLFENNRIVGIAVQREPDTRIHCVREDGTVAMLIVDPTEELKCWIEVETDGVVERAFVLPNNGVDIVYYSVRRTLTSGTVRYLERWAHERECRPGPIVRLADSHIVYDGSPTATLSGLAHLEGKTVVCWADGRDLGTFTVTGGQITLASPVSKACVGLGYMAKRESTKLAYAAQGGTALTQVKRVSNLGLIMDRTHARGLFFGPDLDTLDPLPQIEDARHVGPDEAWDIYDKDMIVFPGSWDTDSRICLVGHAPRPVTLLGMTFSIHTNG